jgi:hypothetical protein
MNGLRFASNAASTTPLTGSGERSASPRSCGGGTREYPNWDLELGATFTNEQGQGQGEIAELDPPRLLAYTWGPEQFRFELQPDGDGCLLVFTHVFDDRTLGVQQAAGWEIYFNRLDAHLAGEFLSEEDAHEGVAQLHERYAKSFGLDPEIGRRTFAQQRPPE